MLTFDLSAYPLVVVLVDGLPRTHFLDGRPLPEDVVGIVREHRPDLLTEAPQPT